MFLHCRIFFFSLFRRTRSKTEKRKSLCDNWKSRFSFTCYQQQGVVEMFFLSKSIFLAWINSIFMLVHLTWRHENKHTPQIQFRLSSYQYGAESGIIQLENYLKLRIESRVENLFLIEKFMMSRVEYGESVIISIHSVWLNNEQSNTCSIRRNDFSGDVNRNQ